MIRPSEIEQSYGDFGLLAPQSEKNIFGLISHETINVSIPIGIQDGLCQETLIQKSDAQDEFLNKAASTAEGTPITIKAPELALDEKSKILSVPE